MPNINIPCPTCNVEATFMCVTASGQVAKKMHKSRVSESNVETDKDRFDRMRDQRRARDKTERERVEKLSIAPNGQRIDPTKPQVKQNRTDRRRYGRTKTAGQGKRHRVSVAAKNESVRQHWHPSKVDVSEDVSAAS